MKSPPSISDYICKKVQEICMLACIGIGIVACAVVIAEINSSASHLFGLVLLHVEQVRGPLGREVIIGDDASVEAIVNTLRKNIQRDVPSARVTFRSTPSNISSKERYSIGIFKTEVIIPVQFASETVGYIKSDITSFPIIVFIVMILATLTIIIVIRFFVQRRLVDDINRNLVYPLQALARSSGHPLELGNTDHHLAEVSSISNDILAMQKQIAQSENEKMKIALIAERNSAIMRTVQILAHDIRKPFSQLQVILQQLYTCKRDANTLDRAQYEIKDSILSVESMISDIMDFSREVQLETKPVNLFGLVDFSIRQAALTYPRKSKVPDIQFEYSLQHTHKPLLDDERMARAFSNILGNAIEAISIIGRRDTGKIWIHTRRISMNENGAPIVEIIIGNDGPAFREEDTAKLFRSFFTKGKKNGTGLGLASVKKIVRLHAGEVFARNVLDGCGVEFVMIVPASSEMESAQYSHLCLPSDLSEILLSRDLAPMDTEIDLLIERIRKCEFPLKVLLLEDEPLYRAALRTVVGNSEDLNKSVILYDADTVDGALALLEQEPNIRHAIVDIDLGEIKNGFDFLEIVKEKYPELRSMVHTNRCVGQDKLLAKALGAADFVSKPMGFETLAKFLARNLTLPCPVTHRIDAPSQSPETEQPRTLLCYVADDSMLMRMHFEMMLSTAMPHGQAHFVRTFDAPEAMLEAARNESPDVVFSDYHFDECSSLNGVEALSQMKILHPLARIFLVSNIDNADGVRLVNECGLSGFLSLPVTKEKLSALLCG